MKPRESEGGSHPQLFPEPLLYYDDTIGTENIVFVIPNFTAIMHQIWFRMGSAQPPPAGELTVLSQNCKLDFGGGEEK